MLFRSNSIKINYSTKKSIKENKKDDIRFHFNAGNILKMICCCNWKRMKKFSKFNDFMDLKIFDLLNLENFMKENIKAKTLRKILFKEKEKKIFDFISKPFCQFDLTEENQKIEKNINQDEEFSNIYVNYLGVKNGNKNSELKKNLIETFDYKLNSL